MFSGAFLLYLYNGRKMPNMETVLDKIRNQAKALNRKVCLTESDDPRNLKAAEKLVKLGYARPVLVGCVEEIKKLAQENNVCLDGVELVDVLKTPELDRYIATVVEIRKNKGLTPEQAREWLKDTCVFSAAMVCAGDAHGYASCGGNPTGYAHNTAQKTKPALQLFKVAPGNKIASSFFVMQMPDPKWGYNGVLFYADCGLNINPDADQLAEIALQTAKRFKMYTGTDPKVAMISCSTNGSAHDPIIDKVVQATAKAKALAPDLMIDGEMQFDAATVPEIGKKKFAGSPVAGQANVLVFPGLRKPFVDGSRGCSVDDIVDMAAVCAVTEWE